MAEAAKGWIDVHHHISPPAWISELGAQNMVTPQSMNWRPEEDVADMDRGGVATSITSVTTPGLWLGDPVAACKLARACNDYAAKLVSDFPGRFRMFVNLPLPDIDGSLREIAYGLDELKADGICLFTSYGDKWLGDPAFDPIYQELNRRKAVVYTHPTTPHCCKNCVPDVNDSIIEFGADTVRAMLRILSSGTVAKYPDMRIIWSHGGGAMPFLADRFDRLANWPTFKPHLPNGFWPEARKFFYDTAQVSHRAPLLALREVIPVGQIMFGTDVPWGTAVGCRGGVERAQVFDETELAAIGHGNAEALMPDLPTAGQAKEII